VSVVWRERIVAAGHRATGPATSESIEAAEAAVGCRLPEDLRALLLESDGVRDEHGFELVFDAERVAGVNREMRTTPDFAELYMPFDPLLFFGAVGNGDLFAFRILAGEVRDDDIFAWDHETDSRTQLSWGLERFLTDPPQT
jgi:hypothetical protein